MTDPRGTATGGVDDPRTQFTTERSYDLLDRMVREIAPKNTGDADPSDRRTITREWQFDANDNLEIATDGTGEQTTRAYTETDQLLTESSPSVPHPAVHGGSGPEVTRYVYDDVDNVRRVVSPRGERTPTPGDFETELRYDAVDQKVAEIQRSTDPDDDQQSLATSWAYDLRGNQVGMVDPRQNARFGGEPEANALVEQRRRFSYEYDRSDNRRFQIEDPGGERNKTEWRYDRNDRMVAVVNPRGHEPGADPEAFRTDFEYDGRDLLVKEISPPVVHAGDDDDRRRVLEYRRREDGKVVERIAPKGTRSEADGDYVTTIAYDRLGDIASVDLPRAPGQYGPALSMLWKRDAVGDPTEIVDARGNTINNTFYDSGHLRFTDRPAWWTMPDGEDAPTERSLEDLVTNGATGDEGGLPDSEAQGDFGRVKAEELPGLLPRAGDTELRYDDEMRLVSVRDAEGNIVRMQRDPLGRVLQTTYPFGPQPEREIVTRTAYDYNGNVVSDTDGEGHETTLQFDQFDRETIERAPGRDETEQQVTRTAYDANSNVTAIQTPRGPSFTERRRYDRLDRLIAEINPEGETTSHEYDASDNPILERSPRGNVDGLTGAQREAFETSRAFNALDELVRETNGLGHETRTGYDDNGNVARLDEPGSARIPGGQVARRITETVFDGRDLPWRETTGSGDDRRTTVTEFDGNGNLRRTVQPRGINSQSGLPRFTDDAQGPVGRSSDVAFEAKVNEYSPDNLLVSVHLPWGDRDTQDGRRFRQDYIRNNRGWIQAIDSPYEWTEDCGPGTPASAPGCTTRTTYLHYDTGWVRSTSDPRLTDPDSGQVIYQQNHSYDYDRRGNQTRWESDQGRVMRRTYNPNGTLATRSAESPDAPSNRSYRYAYNLNESLTEMRDVQLNRLTAIGYDGAERPTLVNEQWDRGRDTRMTYDANGNVAQQRVDGVAVSGGGYQGGKATEFTYDSIDRQTVMDVTGPGGTRRWTQTYWPSNDLRQRIKQRTGPGQGSNGVTEQYFYADDGDLTRMRRQREVQSGAQFDKDQEYDYDANGNRTRDERGSYAYNARSQLRSWTRGPGHPRAGTSVTYEPNGSGAIVRKVDDGRVTLSTYRGDRLLRTEQDPQGGDPASVSVFSYNEVGSLTRVQTTAGGQSQQPTIYRYDAFERLIGARGPQQDEDVSYRYDGLDRRDSRLDDGRTFDSSYVGLTEQLSREEEPGGKAKAYDYDAEGLRLAQTVSVGGATRLEFYGLNANRSVEALEDGLNAPGAGERYRYDPYGELENDSALSADARDNPFRFQAHYYDEAIKTYDMQARHYRPDIARFLTQDRFESGSGDLALQADPDTNNRYAFGAGDPVGYFEVDGHGIPAAIAACARWAPCRKGAEKTGKAAVKFFTRKPTPKKTPKPKAAPKPKATPKRATKKPAAQQKRNRAEQKKRERDAQQRDRAAARADDAKKQANAGSTSSRTEPSRPIARAESPAPRLDAAGRWRTPDGRFARDPQRLATTITARATHGNSAMSSRTAYLYRLTDKTTGQLTKWGVSQNPSTRYGASQMRGLKMEVMTHGTRRQMLNLERFLVERMPGVKNREPWRGVYSQLGRGAPGP